MRAPLFLTLVVLVKFNTVRAQSFNNFSLTQANKLYEEASIIYRNAQNDATAKKLAHIKYEQALNIYRSLKIENLILADIELKLGIGYERDENFEQALRSYLSSVEIRQKLTPEIDSSFFKTFTLIGGIYYLTNKLDSASYYFAKAEDILSKYPNTSGTQRMYNVTGALYYSYGNYRQSVNAFEKAILAVGLTEQHDPSAITVLKMNVASSLRHLGQHKETLKIYKSLLELKVQNDILFLKIGKTYLDLGQYDSALVYLSKVIIHNNTRYQIQQLLDLGQVYQQLHQYPTSLSYYSKAQATANGSLGSKNISLSHAYMGKGQIREAQGHLKAALSYYHLAVQALHFNFDTDNMLRNPEDFSGAVSRLDLFEALRHKARGWWRYYVQTKQLSHLKASLKTYELALKLANQIRRSYDSDEAKLFFTNNVFPAYEEAIAVSYQLHQLTGNTQYAQAAFAFSEGSKAAVLAETLRGLDIRNAQNVPVNLLNEERELRRKITKLTIATVEAKDTSQTHRYREQSRDLEIQLAQVLKRMEKSSAYYQLKYQDGSINIAQLQKCLLDKHTALVEYFLGSQEVYAFIITRDEFQTVRIPLNAHYREAFSQLRRDLYAHEPGKSRRMAWAHPLYQQLIAPIREKIGDKKRLILVPDGELNYLPFEALTTDPEGRDFLLRKFTVQYAYSATLLQRAYGHDQKLQKNSTLLAMAPFADSIGNGFRSARIDPLPASKAEVENIGGRIYLQSDATKEVFLKVAQSYGIIHLATHAKADSDEPLNSYITFYPKNADSLAGYRLYTNELYNLRLDSAKLVVLSACETGGGRLVRGEGVMSLARAFAYAGCPNIVMTLWKAEDRTTADIIARMHNFLKKGYNKDEALRQAKLDYLDSDLPDYRKAPYFWANFVFIGDHTPIYPSRNWLWITITVTALLVLGLALYLKRKQPKFIRG